MPRVPLVSKFGKIKLKGLEKYQILDYGIPKMEQSDRAKERKMTHPFCSILKPYHLCFRWKKTVTLERVYK